MNQLTVARLSVQRILQSPRDYMFGFLLLQGLRWAIGAPIITYLFYHMLSAAGLSSVTNANVAYVLSHPIALVFLLLLAFGVTFFVFFEFGFYFLLAHFQRSGEDFSYWDILKRLRNKLPYFFSVHFVVFTIYFVLLLPIASLGMSSTWTSSLRIPEFITDELMHTTSGKLIIGAVLLVVLLVNVRFIYSVYYFSTEPDTTIWQALKKSWHATRGQTFSIVTTLGGLVISMSLIAAAGIALLVVPLYAAESLVESQLPLVAGIVLTLVQGWIFALGALLQPLLTEAVTVLERREADPYISAPFQRRKWLDGPPIMYTALFVGFVVFTAINTTALQETIYQPMTKIVAHRGYASVALENTIASLEAAAEAGADYVEMDIQETKDGKLVVYHDKTLRRLAGDPRTVGELTLDELTAIDITDGHHKERIPSFEAYVDRAKELGMKLLVETKTYGHESDAFEETLANVLEEKEVTGEYVVQSLDLASLRKLESIDPRIATSDVIALTVGGFPNTPAPYVSVEDFSVNASLVQAANAQEKQLFVWTVNKESLMHDHIRLGVYGIITNHVSTAVRVRDSYEDGEGMIDRLLWLAEQTRERVGL
ncbi:glycerophosphodiester phosphodiesterase [Planococcaceae bacterium Storch 2/2-2]|nr:glycerophosphodiester phosphodiesterase [Planococcaceae bacterium Storch 2/2-2]